MTISNEAVAVVTGGSTGIGASICEHLLEAGYRVVNIARRGADIDSPRLENVCVDLADREATREAAATIAARHRVTTLVHNAGVIRPALLEQVELADFDYLTNIHLAAAITLSQAFLPAMKEAAFGRIVLIGSRAALGLQTRTSYSATKIAMTGLARTWALELGAFGITVNCVSPGPVASTEMFHAVIPEDSPKMREMSQGIPVRRLGEPDDVARAVMFMVAPDNGFVTGQTLMVCGGASLGSLTL
jgi:NAD(P)-dependent dehydrogenase (short-subunit alcohol dehydrogenase family)